MEKNIEKPALVCIYGSIGASDRLHWHGKYVPSEYGITVLMITHDENLAKKTARTALISDGKIEETLYC